jgi:hypothetical protein
MRCSWRISYNLFIALKGRRIYAYTSINNQINDVLQKKKISDSFDPPINITTVVVVTLQEHGQRLEPSPSLRSSFLGLFSMTILVWSSTEQYQYAAERLMFTFNLLGYPWCNKVTWHPGKLQILPFRKTRESDWRARCLFGTYFSQALDLFLTTYRYENEYGYEAHVWLSFFFFFLNWSRNGKGWYSARTASRSYGNSIPLFYIKYTITISEP